MIKTDIQHKAILAQVETLMNKGSQHLTQEEKVTTKLLAEAVQAYEQKKFKIKKVSLPQLISYHMYEKGFAQKEMASYLGISAAKLSLVLTGKQKPDVALLKALHTKLKIEAHFLLTAA